MVQKQTYLEVADNSGAKELQCIHIIGSTRKHFAYIGEEIKCAIKSAVPGAQVKKGEVVTAVIVRTTKEYRRSDGSYIRFGDNAAVIVKTDGSKEPIATRIFGPVARELKNAGYTKIVSLAPEVL
jgi:large subunit ribosomal protein L14